MSREAAVSPPECGTPAASLAARIVVIGGSGNFGARICRALASDPRIEVIAAGRTPPTGRGDAGVRSARLDTASPGFASALKELSPRIVIHCAGPFQGQDYRVALAAVEAGAHYIDLADGRHFVTAFGGSVDAPARAAGLLALCGASTVPALSSAVVDHFRNRFLELHEIEIVIAPGQRAPRGAATIAAVLSYAGRPFQWLIRGRWAHAWGWQELRFVRVGGAGARLAAACDVPDLELLPARYPSVRTVTFRAALELKVQHLALWSAAALRRIGIPLPLERWALPLDRLASILNRFGGETGGMLVALVGDRHDRSTGRVEWHLTAPAEHGPEIPCMAAILLARRLVDGRLGEVGAFPCMGFLSLAEFESEFARWGISTVVKECAA
jgi:hypothetical protein